MSENEIIDLISSYGFSINESVRVLKYILMRETAKSSIKNYLDNTFLYYRNKEFSVDEIIIMINKNKSIIIGGDNYRNDVYNWFNKMGYNEKTIKEIIFRSPIIVTFLPQKLAVNFEFLISLGIEKDSIYNMTRITPSLLSMDVDKIDTIYSYLVSLFSIDEIVEITSSYPAVLTLGLSNLAGKIDFLKEIDLNKYKEIIISNPKNLIQGVRTTYIRYMILMEYGVLQDDRNRLLFRSHKNWPKDYLKDIDIKFIKYGEIYENTYEKKEGMIK